VVQFLKKNGLNVKFKYAKAKSGDPTKLVADNKKIKKILHWNPSRNNLNKILTTAISWHKNLI
jgi:UDP-glucose 4-epimerase